LFAGPKLREEHGDMIIVLFRFSLMLKYMDSVHVYESRKYTIREPITHLHVN